MLGMLVSCKKDDGKDDGADNNGENNGADNNGENNGAELPAVDFFSGDLSEFVELDEKYYKGFTVVVDPDRVSSFDVENKIIGVLYKYKSAESVEGDGIISVGDTVNIFYKGYYMSGENKVYFSGGSNVGGKSYALGIGSASFIPGFEYNMIGKNPADYDENNPMIIESYFPEGYQSAELAGKTAFFEVYVEKDADGKYLITEYDAPSLDDNFITETLKLSSQTLENYDGETLTDRYRSYVKETLISENGLDEKTLIINAFWDSVLNGAVIKKYPEREVKEYVDSYVEELDYYYGYYSTVYEYDEFMCLYLGLDKNADWRGALTDMAKSQVKRLLVFYEFMNLAGITPTEEEYLAMFDEYLTRSLTNNDITPDKYATAEEYEAAKEKYKQELISSKGEDYFKSMIYYELAVETICEYANVVEKAE